MSRSNLHSSFRNWVKKHLHPLIRLRNAFRTVYQTYFFVTNPKRLGKIGKSAILSTPCDICSPSLIYLDDYTRIRPGFAFEGTEGKFIVKKYSSIGRNAVVVTGNHTKTVGIPQFLLGPTHINDNHKDVIVEEDVWMGANCTLLPGAHIGRGCVVGAGSLVNKELPPYALAVGTPCKIIASSYSIDEILRHESFLYPPEERFSKEFLEEIFETHYQGKKSIALNNLTDEQINKILSRLNN